MRQALLALLAACAIACGGGGGKTVGGVRIALNWFPESEHGGYFAALVDGLYSARGATVELLSGGPGVPVIPRVASREVDFGVANADDVVAARAAGVPVVALLEPIHQSPLCVMVHAKSNITRLDQLRDLTLAMQPGTPQVAWLEHTGRLQGVQVVPYSGSVAPFLASERYAQQGYVFSEPIIARAKGADVRCIAFAETGFNPYASGLVTSEALLRERPDLVRAVTEASAEGWKRYVDDPSAANAEILKRNPEIGRDALQRGAEALRPLVLDDDAKRDGVGSMRPERWAAIAAQMREIGMIDKPVEPSTLYDARFVPAPAK